MTDQASDIRIIETTYRGVRFRSRTEARWAVFFETLGVRWEYEPEAFTDGSTSYLPDFWLPDQRFWWEVKPERELEEEEESRLNMLAKLTKQRVFVAFGSPAVRLWEKCDTCPMMTTKREQTKVIWWCDHGNEVVWDEQHEWCECPECGQLGVEFNGYSDRLCTCFPTTKGDNSHSPRLHQAYSAARAYRFWDPGQ